MKVPTRRYEAKTMVTKTKKTTRKNEPSARYMELADTHAALVNAIRRDLSKHEALCLLTATLTVEAEAVAEMTDMTQMQVLVGLATRR